MVGWSDALMQSKKEIDSSESGSEGIDREITGNLITMTGGTLRGERKAMFKRE